MESRWDDFTKAELETLRGGLPDDPTHRLARELEAAIVLRADPPPCRQCGSSRRVHPNTACKVWVGPRP